MYFPFHFYILKYMHISVKKKKVINRTLTVSCTEDVLCKIHRGEFCWGQEVVYVVYC